MLKSMTGYGIAHVESENFSAFIEIKSLNSKFLDLSLKTPKFLHNREIDLRNIVTQVLERGRANVLIEINYKKELTPSIKINASLLKSYYTNLQELAHQLADTPQDLFRLALQMPDVISQELTDEGTSVADWKLLEETLNQALQNCNDFRLQEGKILEDKLLEHLQSIHKFLKQVEEEDPKRVAQIRTKITQKISEIQHDELFDRNRFEQEMIYYIEKLDITEEKVRLKAHLNYFAEVLKLPEANGKKLGFIAQEIGREINTIGSKANNAVIQRTVIEMKEELEKIKEQLMNAL